LTSIGERLSRVDSCLHWLLTVKSGLKDVPEAETVLPVIVECIGGLQAVRADLKKVYDAYGRGR